MTPIMTDPGPFLSGPNFHTSNTRELHPQKHTKTLPETYRQPSIDDFCKHFLGMTSIFFQVAKSCISFFQGEFYMRDSPWGKRIGKAAKFQQVKGQICLPLGEFGTSLEGA